MNKLQAISISISYSSHLLDLPTRFASDMVLSPMTTSKTTSAQLRSPIRTRLITETTRDGDAAWQRF